MNDDAPATAGEGLPSGRSGDTAARPGGPKRSGTFVYPLPSTPLPSSTPLAGPVRHGATAEGDSAIDRDPAGGVGAGTSEEGTTLVTSTSTSNSTNGSANGTGTHAGSATDSLGTVSTPVPSRRNSMGVASVRIAARLAQNELGTRTTRSGSDPTADNDELLTLLGEYLLAGGLEKPELHATLGGQPIVVDLQTPQRHAR